MVDVTTNDSYRDIVLEIFKADGVTPGSIEGIPAWLSSDETIMRVAGISADGMRADMIDFPAIGTGAKVVVTGDADLGAGVVPIVGETEPHNVTLFDGGPAVRMTIKLGPVVPKV